MSSATPQTKRPYPSTSDCDSIQSSPASPSDQNAPLSRKEKRQLNKQAKKQKKIDDFIETQSNIMQGKEKESNQTSPIELKLDEINKKLSKMLTKEDKNFIKSIIKSTVEEMKESLLGGITRRLEILEGENHDHFVAVDRLEKEINSKDEELAKLREENGQLKKTISNEKNTRERSQNELEQYSRRNNVRISGIPDDVNRQSSDSVIKSVVKELNEKSKVGLKEEDIDIAHRLGKFISGESRPVVVKFVRRQTKVNVMKVAKVLREASVYVNEDLTKLNHEVLSSLRLKDPDVVDKCWSFEGKLFAIFKSNPDNSVQIEYKDYQLWRDKPWPKR